MKRTFPTNTGEREKFEPIEYIDSIVESSYIKGVGSSIMKKVRELSLDLEILGSLNPEPHMISSIEELNQKKEGIWIVDSSTYAITELNAVYSLTLYKRIKNPGFFYNTYTTQKIFQFYAVKCKRTVPRITVDVCKFDLFEDELKRAVSGFKVNAERSGIIIGNGKA